MLMSLIRKDKPQRILFENTFTDLNYIGPVGALVPWKCALL
jgi:hypothetical protein